MSSLAELPELVGFFSYSRRDDEWAGGSLSALRKRIHDELGLQLGRDVKVWQDAAAIPHGALWENEIAQAIAESVFFIPIVTPSALTSSHCAFEFRAFLARESSLHRGDLIFPILYVRVPALSSEDQRDKNEVLKIIHARQYSDWTKIRQDDLASSIVVRKQIEAFCHDIVEALLNPWVSPEERQRLADHKREEELRRLDVERQEAQRKAEITSKLEAERKEEEARREALSQQAREEAQQQADRARARDAERQEIEALKQQEARRQAQILSAQREEMERKIVAVNKLAEVKNEKKPETIGDVISITIFIIIVALALWFFGNSDWKKFGIVILFFGVARGMIKIILIKLRPT